MPSQYLVCPEVAISRRIHLIEAKRDNRIVSFCSARLAHRFKFTCLTKCRCFHFDQNLQNSSANCEIKTQTLETIFVAFLNEGSCAASVNTKLTAWLQHCACNAKMQSHCVWNLAEKNVQPLEVSISSKNHLQKSIYCYWLTSLLDNGGIQRTFFFWWFFVCLGD